MESTDWRRDLARKPIKAGHNHSSYPSATAGSQSLYLCRLSALPPHTLLTLRPNAPRSSQDPATIMGASQSATSAASSSLATDTDTTTLSGEFVQLVTREQLDDFMQYVAANNDSCVVISDPAMVASLTQSCVTRLPTASPSPLPSQTTAETLEPLSLADVSQSLAAYNIRPIYDHDTESINELAVTMSQRLSASLSESPSAPPPSKEEMQRSLAFLDDLPTVEPTAVASDEELHVRTLLSSISLSGAHATDGHSPSIASSETGKDRESSPAPSAAPDHPIEASDSEQPASPAQAAVVRRQHQEQQGGFFSNWPSFHIEDKIGACAFLGYIFGFWSSRNALRFLFRVKPQDYEQARTVEDVSVLPGFVAMIPAVVVGTAGVLVSVPLFHAYEASRRAITGDRSRPDTRIAGPLVTTTFKMLR